MHIEQLQELDSSLREALQRLHNAIALCDLRESTHPALPLALVQTEIFLARAEIQDVREQVGLTVNDDADKHIAEATERFRDLFSEP